MSKPNGGPAFPNESHDGMSLRDYFAAQAMQAFFSGQGKPNALNQDYVEKMGVQAYRLADALIKARS